MEFEEVEMLPESFGGEGEKTEDLRTVDFEEDVWNAFRENFKHWQQDGHESPSSDYELDKALSITMTRVLRWISHGETTPLDRHVRYKGMNPPRWFLDDIREDMSAQSSKESESDSEIPMLKTNVIGESDVEAVATRLWAEKELNNARDDRERSVGHLAHNYQTMRFLLEMCRTRQEFLTAVDNNGDTPLHAACQKGDNALVQLLLYSEEVYGDTLLCFEDVNIHAKNTLGNLPIHAACASAKNVELVENLIEALLECLEKTNKNGAFFVNMNGQTPFDVACESGRTEVIEAFLNNEKYMEYERWLEEHQKDVPALLRVAKKDGKQYGDIIKLLVKNDFKINQKDQQDDTALHHAARAGLPYNVDVLLDLGANPRVKNDNGQRPIHVACEKGFSKMVGNLYHYDKRSLAYHKDEKNVVEIACEMGHVSVIEALLDVVRINSKQIGGDNIEYGWDVLLLRNLDSNRAPLQIAADLGHDEIISSIWECIFGDENSGYILKALMRAKKTGIEKILKDYQDQPCCGFDNLQAFFDNELELFRQKIAERMKGSDFEMVSESPEKFALLRDDDTEQAYCQSLQTLCTCLANDFARADLEEQIDRINIVDKISSMIDTIDDARYRKSDKKQYVQDTFDEIKPYCQNQMIFDTVKLVLILASALVVGAAIGLGAAWGAAIMLSSSVSIALVCGVATAMAVRGMFNSHAHKVHKIVHQLSRHSVEQACLSGVSSFETESSLGGG